MLPGKGCVSEDRTEPGYLEGVVPDGGKSNHRGIEARRSLVSLNQKRGSEDEVGREKEGREERRIYKGWSSGSSATSRCDAHL